MKKQHLNPDAIISSLKLTLTLPLDANESLRSLRGMLSHLPSDSLHILRDRRQVSFYRSTGSDRTYLRKSSDLLYQLARARYLKELMRTLQELPFRSVRPDQWDHQFNHLAGLIRNFADGNLDVARIVLSPKQYAWFVGSYRKKKPPSNDGRKVLTLKNGERVLSKSEQSIGNALLDLAVPSHYEEALRINVQPLVESLSADLSARNQLEGNLFYYKGNTCWWNVPKELQYMNTPGSLWHTYNYRTGCVLIHPDFTVMLADGSLLYWEHEGLLDQPIYRINAAERVMVMRFSGSIPLENLIETTERESTSLPTLEQIIQARILPRLWF